VGQGATRNVSLALQSVNALCLLAWLFAITRAGEKFALSVRQRVDPAEQERLVEQLQTINAVLMRASRK
jgi:hypothetical protein